MTPEQKLNMIQTELQRLISYLNDYLEFMEDEEMDVAPIESVEQIQQDVWDIYALTL